MLYRNYDSTPFDNQIKPGLQVVNRGTAPVSLARVKLRYWFTRDGGSTTVPVDGLGRFVDNIATHLENGLMGWLFGALGDAGIKMPKSFDLAGIFELVMDVLARGETALFADLAQAAWQPQATLGMLTGSLPRDASCRRDAA